MKLYSKYPKTLARMLCIALTLSSLAYSQTPNRSKQTRPNTQRTLTPREIAQKTLPSVVLLVTQNSSGEIKSLGSGFFIQDDVIATNHHVIEGASRVRARIVGQKAVYEVTGFLGIDESRDLALLKVSGIKGRPLPFGNSNQVAVGDVVYAVGNPEGFEGTFSQGIVSGIRQFEGQRYIQITAPVSHGSSGGPVLNKDGEVIGVAVASVEEGQNLNFAVPVSDLRALISSGNRDVVAIDGNSVFSLTGFGNIDDAIKQVRTYPNSAIVYYKLGEAYKNRLWWSYAVEAYKRAIELKPDYAEAYLGMGWAYGKGYVFTGAKDKAFASIESIKQAIRIRPNYAEAHLELGIIYNLLVLKDEAIAALRVAIQIKPDYPDAYRELGISYSIGKSFSDCVVQSPINNRLIELPCATELKEAARLLRKAVQMNPNDSWAWQNLGAVFEELKRFDEAFEAYKNANENIKLLYAYKTSNRLSEGLEYGRLLVRMRPKSGEAHYFLGMMFVWTGDKLSALEEYKILKDIEADGIAELLFKEIYK